jgi:hypothetical protein
MRQKTEDRDQRAEGGKKSFGAVSFLWVSHPMIMSIYQEIGRSQ